MNPLEIGVGGRPAPSPEDSKAVQPNQISLQQAKAPPSEIMQKFGSAKNQVKAQFNQLAEAKKQISATKFEIGQLRDLGDTVTAKDVVKHSAGIVAAGVPAVEVATILADMPEGGQQLQAWVVQKYEEATANEGKVNKLMGIAQHQLAVTSLQNILAHSAEAHAKQQLMAATPAGSA